jgi:hypothetical protein
MAKVVKSAVEADFQNAQVGVHQQFAGKIYLYSVQVFKNGYSHLRLEKPAKEPSAIFVRVASFARLTSSR